MRIPEMPASSTPMILNCVGVDALGVVTADLAEITKDDIVEGRYGDEGTAPDR